VILKHLLQLKPLESDFFEVWLDFSIVEQSDFAFEFFSYFGVLCLGFSNRHLSECHIDYCVVEVFVVLSFLALGAHEYTALLFVLLDLKRVALKDFLL
jgi:hypothetical protein